MEDAADASGVMVTLIQLGNVVGVAVFGTLFFSSLSVPTGPAEWGHAAELASFGIAVATAAAGGVSRLRGATSGR
jgi:hypothetical protein